MLKYKCMVNFRIKDRPLAYLYAFLIIIVCGTLLFYLLAEAEHKSISENLITSAIEITITVVLIERLLSLERKRRLVAINTYHSNEMTVYIAVVLYKVFSEFGYKPSGVSDLDGVMSLNKDLQSTTKSFLASKQYRRFLLDVRKAGVGASPVIELVRKMLDDSFPKIQKMLNGAKPYPDPLLVSRHSAAFSSLAGSFKALDFLYEFVNVDLVGIEKKYPDDKEGSSVARKILGQALKRIVGDDDGSDDRANFNRAFSGYLETLLDIHNKAEKNELYYDV